MSPEISRFLLVPVHVDELPEGKTPLPNEPIALSKRQFETYSTALSYLEEHGKPATLEELAPLLGLEAKSAVRERLMQLVRRGCLTHDVEHQTSFIPCIPRGYFYMRKKRI